MTHCVDKRLPAYMEQGIRDAQWHVMAIAVTKYTHSGYIRGCEFACASFQSTCQVTDLRRVRSQHGDAKAGLLVRAPDKIRGCVELLIDHIEWCAFAESQPVADAMQLKGQASEGLGEGVVQLVRQSLALSRNRRAPLPLHVAVIGLEQQQ